LGSLAGFETDSSPGLLHCAATTRHTGEADVDDHIRAQLRDYIGTNFLFGDHDRLPSDEESLLATGVIDSTGILEIIEYLEDHFDVRVEESETVVDNLGSIGGLTRFVHGKTAHRDAAASR
jgi:acyl carrier protein